MRKEPFGVGDYVHILKRGAKGLPIVKNLSDQWRFLKILAHVNDEYLSDRWEDEVMENRTNTDASIFDRPVTWPAPQPLVQILAYTLMPNHFHILVKEIMAGGTAKFMQKVGNSMTGHFNQKYGEVGSLFQGSYKARRVDDDTYLRYVAVYIMVKNSFELYPGGLKEASKNFDQAWQWASQYPFTSLRAYITQEKAPIVFKNILGETFGSPEEFKTFASEMIAGRMADLDTELDFEK